MNHRLVDKRGFTLIELVMVIIIIGILAAVALPNFFDFRTDARNAATNGALGGMRAALSIAKASIALKEASTAPPYPTLAEVQANNYIAASHPNLATYASNFIMDPASGFPPNPWTLNTVPAAQWSTIFDCSSLAKPAVLSAAGQANIGWCYSTVHGQIWANSTLNGGSATATENTF